MAYPSCPTDTPIDDPIALRKWLRTVATVVDRHNTGKFNVTGTIKLAVGEAFTTLDDPRITLSSFIDLMPITASAATAKQSLYVTVSNGVATIHHINNTQTDRTFTYVVIG